MHISQIHKPWDSLRLEWLGNLIYAFPSPNIIHLVLGRLLKWGRKIIMFTPFWLDHSWFPEIMKMAAEPPRRFQPSEWLVWNAATRKAIPKVMGDIKMIDCLEGHIAICTRNWIAWELQKKKKITNECFNAGILSTIRKGYTHLKFVSETWWST